MLSIAFGIAHQLETENRVSSNLIIAAVKDKIKGRNYENSCAPNCSLRKLMLRSRHIVRSFSLRYEPRILHDLIDSKRQVWHQLFGND